ncbi:MAG: hypothetical protein GY820_22445, partial [Gammaproteobacteria bacterium]|nr:hypothetical protein [Gammaproteobacteria bacterium]
MTAFDDALAAVGTLVSMHIESGGAFVQPDADVVEQARAALPVLRAEHDDTRRYLRGCEQWFYPNDTPNKDMAKAVASNYLKLRAEHERVV